MRLGYVTNEDQLSTVEVDKTYRDTVQDKKTEQVQLKALLNDLQIGDSVYVDRLHYVARSMRGLRVFVNEILAKKASIIFVADNVEFLHGAKGVKAATLIKALNIFADFESGSILQFQQAGVNKAKAEGRFKGKQANTSRNKAIQAKLEAGRYTVKDIAAQYKVSPSQVYKLKRTL